MSSSMRRNPRPAMLCVAESVLCSASLFRRAVGGPKVLCHLVPFSLDFETWRRQEVAQDRETLLRFLDGNEVVCDKNFVEFILPNRGRDIPGYSEGDSDGMLLDFLFFNNADFQVVSNVNDLDITVKIVPGSGRIIKVFEGHTQRYGDYRKIVVGFSTKVRLCKAVRDISPSSLAKYFWINSSGKADVAGKNIRALKAYIKDVDGIYVSKLEAFIAPAPQSLEDRVDVIKSELAAECSSELVRLIKLGVEFADSADARRVLTEGLKRFNLPVHGGLYIILGTFGGLESRYAGALFRLPRTELAPWLFVEHVRAGITACENLVSKWIADGRFGDATIQIGNFHMGTIGAKSKQISQTEILGRAVDFFNFVIKFLGAVADLVELFMGDSSNVAQNGSKAIRVNIGNVVQEKVKLSPADYMDSSVEAVRDLARLYVVGE